MAGVREKHYNDIPLDKYIERKLDMLRTHFKIYVTKAEERYMMSLPTETQVDAFARKIIMDKL